jgi:hypothetical protein
MYNLDHTQPLPIAKLAKEAIISMMHSISGDAYTQLMDYKAMLIEDENYEHLAELRDLEEEHECPIMFKYSV